MPEPSASAGPKRSHKIDERISYNRLFFLLALGFAAVTAWAVYDEVVTRREYKVIQRSFFALDLKKSQASLGEARREVESGDAYQELLEHRVKLEKAAQSIDPVRRTSLEQELGRARAAAEERARALTFAKSELDESYYEYRKSLHEAAPDKSDRRRGLEELRVRVRKLEEDVTAARGERHRLATELDDLTQRPAQVELERRLERLRKPIRMAERTLATAQARLAGPLGPRTEVIQQDLPQLGRVDRCQTCHLAIDRPGFEEEVNPAFRSHPLRRTLLRLHPPDRFGCTACHDGQGRATTAFFAHAPGPDEDPEAFHAHYWDWPLLTGPPGGTGTEYMESTCRGCHVDQRRLTASLPCSRDAECPSTDDRPMICATPPPTRTKDAPYYSVAEATAAARQEDRPTPPKQCLDVAPKRLEKVRTAATPKKRERAQRKMLEKAKVAIVDLAPNLSQGLAALEEIGCTGCHAIPGFEGLPKRGPDLRRIAHKADPGWLVAWIQEPRAFHPNTAMPDFFPDELPPGVAPADAKAEARAMAAFLLFRSRNSKEHAYESAKSPPRGDAERGKTLATTLGCAGCHTLALPEVDLPRRNRETHFDLAPDLTDIGRKTTERWLADWLLAPQRYASATRMPSLRLSAQAAADLAAFLASRRGDEQHTIEPINLETLVEDRTLVERGEELVTTYGCYGCHEIEGFEGKAPPSVDLSDFGLKRADRLDFGDIITNPREQTWSNWLKTKLEHPRLFAYERADLKMPEYALAETEVRALMVALKGMRGANRREVQELGHRLPAEAKARERGRALLRRYHCYGCHEVDGHQSDLLQLAQYRGENAKFGAPPLTEQGARTQPAWLFQFLLSPFVMRPLPKLRMPTFRFTEEQATTLVAMFSALDGSSYPFAYYADIRPENPIEYRVGKELFAVTQCQKCHVVGDPQAKLPKDVVSPNLLLTRVRLRAEWMSQFLADPMSTDRNTAMTAFWIAQNPLAMPKTRARLKDLTDEELAPYLASPERQIKAVRNYLYILEEETGLDGARSVR